MQAINEELKIYRIQPGEMTMGQIRKYFTNFEDDCLVERFSVFYDAEQDAIFFGDNKADEEMERFFIRVLSNLPYAEEFLLKHREKMRVSYYLETTGVLLNCVKARLEKLSAAENGGNPDSRFIKIGDDIFQISKIVSVRRRDECERPYIEVFITNRQASVKKEFGSKSMRDEEFKRISRCLAANA